MTATATAQPEPSPEALTGGTRASHLSQGAARRGSRAIDGFRRSKLMLHEIGRLALFLLVFVHWLYCVSREGLRHEPYLAVLFALAFVFLVGVAFRLWVGGTFLLRRDAADGRRGWGIEFLCRRGHYPGPHPSWPLFCEVIALSWLIVVTGGLSSPYIEYFVVMAALGDFVLERRWHVWALPALVTILYAGVALGHFLAPGPLAAVQYSAFSSGVHASATAVGLSAAGVFTIVIYVGAVWLSAGIMHYLSAAVMEGFAGPRQTVTVELGKVYDVCGAQGLSHETAQRVVRAFAEVFDGRARRRMGAGPSGIRPDDACFMPETAELIEIRFRAPDRTGARLVRSSVHPEYTDTWSRFTRSPRERMVSRIALHVANHITHFLTAADRNGYASGSFTRIAATLACKGPNDAVQPAELAAARDFLRLSIIASYWAREHRKPVWWYNGLPYLFLSCSRQEVMARIRSGSIKNWLALLPYCIKYWHDAEHQCPVRRGPLCQRAEGMLCPVYSRGVTCDGGELATFLHAEGILYKFLRDDENDIDVAVDQFLSGTRSSELEGVLAICCPKTMWAARAQYLERHPTTPVLFAAIGGEQCATCDHDKAVGGWLEGQTRFNVGALSGFFQEARRGAP